MSNLQLQQLFYSTSFCSVNLGEQKHRISQHIFWRNFSQRVFHPRNTTCCEQITGPWYGFQDVMRVRQTVPKGFESGCDRQFLYRDPGFHCCHHACISAYLSKARSNKKNMLNGIELTEGALKPFASQWVGAMATSACYFHPPLSLRAWAVIQVMKPLLFTSWWLEIPPKLQRKNKSPLKCHFKVYNQIFTRHEIFLRGWKRSFREMGGLWCSILAMNVPDLVLFSTSRHANMIKHGRPKHHYNTDTFLTHTTFSKPTYALPPKKNRQTCHVPTCWISNSHRELVTLKVLQLARPWQWVPASDPRCMFCNDGWPHKWNGHYLNRPVNVSFKGHWILNLFLFKGRTPITKILQVFSCPKDPQTNGAQRLASAWMTGTSSGCPHPLAMI